MDLKNKREVELWLLLNKVNKYVVNDDLSVEVFDSVNLGKLSLEELPIKFTTIHGNFVVENNSLTNYKNFPDLVNGHLNMFGNKIKTIDGFNTIVKGHIFSDVAEDIEFKNNGRKLKI